uniref:prevent-host-death protein n=1 Tax=Cupriavidus ulmosensis TaxID=3065913 RepID=UPI00296B54AC|nr:prevent-host-death protein [Cupriavidus sp. CV2]
MIEAVSNGVEQEIIILDGDGRPAAKLVPLTQAAVALSASPSASGKRLIGIAAGKHKIPDDIDASNEEIRRMFEGDEPK